MKKIKNIVLFIAILLSYILYSSLIVLLFKKIGLEIKAMNVLPKTIFLIAIELSFILILWFIYRKELKEEFKDYKKNFSDYFKLGLKVWAIGLLIMMTSNIILNLVFHVSPSNESNVQALLKQLPVYILIATIIYAPFSEEIIFRKSLDKCFSNKFLFIIVSGLIFGSLHVLTSKNSLEMLYIIPYGAFGSAFAYMYYKTKNIFTSMTIHMLHNSILVIVSLISLAVI